MLHAPSINSTNSAKPSSQKDSKKKQNQARMGALRPSKPDIDNIIKAILDGCNKVIYNDDAQVHSIRARKLYETYENPPSIDVKVSWV